jgi:hypothetical protein
MLLALDKEYRLQLLLINARLERVMHIQTAPLLGRR